MKRFKNKSILILALSFGIAFITSCEKQSILDVNEPTQSVSGTGYNKAASFPIKIRKGTHIDRLDCTRSLPCGPCPGICIRWESQAIPNPLPFNYELSEKDIDNELSLIHLSKINSSTFRISIQDGTNCYYENKLIFNEDVNLEPLSLQALVTAL